MGFKVSLSTSLAELNHELAFARNPLEVLKIINLYPKRSWKIRIRFDQSGGTMIEIQAPEKNIFDWLSYLPIKAFDCERLDVVIDDELFSCNWTEQLSASAASNSLEFESNASNEELGFNIRLVGYCGKTIPSSLTSQKEIQVYLDNYTWLGSRLYVKDRYNVDIQILGTALTFRNRPAILLLTDALVAGKPYLELSCMLGNPPVGELYYSAFWRLNVHRFRWSESGLVSEHELSRLFTTSVDLPPGEIEVTFPGRVLGPDGSLALDSNLKIILKGIQGFVGSLPDNPKWSDYLNRGLTYENKLSAARIDERKNHLLRTKFIYFEDKLVYKEPLNENELVALHQKLEGLGALPFAHFCSLEYTPKLGIDAIVNYKIEVTESVHNLATVEFEYSLMNFFDHEHPVEQTDMIICWELPTNTVSEYQPESNKPWLGFLKCSGKIIKVVCVSKYPGLRAAQLGG